MVRFLAVVVSPLRLVNLLPPVVLLLPCCGGLDLFFVFSYCVLFCVLVCIGPMAASVFFFLPRPHHCLCQLLLLHGLFFKTHMQSVWSIRIKKIGAVSIKKFVVYLFVWVLKKN